MDQQIGRMTAGNWERYVTTSSMLSDKDTFCSLVTWAILIIIVVVYTKYMSFTYLSDYTVYA